MHFSPTQLKRFMPMVQIQTDLYFGFSALCLCSSQLLHHCWLYLCLPFTSPNHILHHMLRHTIQWNPWWKITPTPWKTTFYSLSSFFSFFFFLPFVKHSSSCLLVKLTLNIQTVFVNIVCEECSRILFMNTFVLNNNNSNKNSLRTVKKFCQDHRFWSRLVINSDFKWMLQQLWCLL